MDNKKKVSATRSSRTKERLKKELQEEIKEVKNARKSTRKTSIKTTKKKYNEVIKPVEKLEVIDVPEEIELLDVEVKRKHAKVNKALIVIIIILTFLVVAGTSFAWYTASYNPEEDQVVEAGKLDVYFENEVDEINLVDMYPQSDINGMQNTPYTFSVRNDGSLNSSYTIYLNDIAVTEGSTRLDDTYVRYELIVNGESTGALSLNDLTSTSTDSLKQRVLYTGTVASKKTTNFALRLWIREDATTDIENQEFRATLSLKSEQENANLVCSLASGTSKTVGAKYVCDPGDGEFRNFYVLTNNDSTIDLIMDRNITQGTETTKMNWESAMNYMEANGYTTSWTNVKSISLPDAQAIANAGGIVDWNYEEATESNWSYFGVNSTSDKSKRNNYAWLYNYTVECTEYGCDSNTTLNTNEAYGYWTKNNKFGDETMSWFVGRMGNLYCESVSTTSRSVRPVITIDSNKLN